MQTLRSQGVVNRLEAHGQYTKKKKKKREKLASVEMNMVTELLKELR